MRGPVNAGSVPRWASELANDCSTCVAMGASLGVGLGLRHVLPPEQARRVVDHLHHARDAGVDEGRVPDDRHDPPPLGHVVIVLDNGITAMTGQQEHPATGRSLEHGPAGHISIEGLVRAKTAV